MDVAAAKYHKRKLAEPGDEKADKGLSRAVNMAHTLYVARAEAERPPRAPVILVVGTMFGLILLAALYAVIVTFTRRPTIQDLKPKPAASASVRTTTSPSSNVFGPAACFFRSPR